MNVELPEHFLFSVTRRKEKGRSSITLEPPGGSYCRNEVRFRALRLALPGRRFFPIEVFNTSNQQYYTHHSRHSKPMNPDYSESIPKTDWSQVSTCCEGGRCTAPVEKPFSQQLQERADKIREQEPDIDDCERIAIEYQNARAKWNALRKKPDMVKQPPHYARFKIEPMVAIQDWKLPFALGCVVKYIVRAPHKGNELLDLEKAEEFLRRYVEMRRAELQE